MYLRYGGLIKQLP